ncbi:MAG: PIN domain-containing protein [Candidatus Aenigmarchaeota archaeon]|nr:PIN domain-containing protein [Candidatus Aenigmarchaeota archaeon]
MKLVVDANVLFSFFRKYSSTRKFILSHPELELFVPEYVFDELEEHKEEIKRKSKIDENVFKLTKKELLRYTTVVPLDEFKEFWDKAKKISPDLDDAQYFAVAFALSCVLWSNDKALKRQSCVKVWNTKEFIELMGL